MLGDTSDILAGILLGMLLSIGFVETILRSVWSKMYFTTGLPIFFLRIPVERHYSNTPTSYYLETHFQSTWWANTLVFNEIEAGMYAFREKFFDFRMYAFRYSPVMHGLLIFDRNNKQVIIKGFANWTALIFELLFLMAVIAEASFPDILLFVFISFLFFLFIYLVQHSRFSDVARFAAEAWTRKYVEDKEFFGY